MLPDETLQQGGVIGEMIEDLHGEHSIALENEFNLLHADSLCRPVLPFLSPVLRAMT